MMKSSVVSSRKRKNGQVPERKRVHEWTPCDVGQWMKEKGFSKYVDLMCIQHHIDGPALLTLTEYNLIQPPLQIKILGDVKRLFISIRKLQLENQDLVKEFAVSQVSRNHTKRYVRIKRHDRLDVYCSEDLNDADGDDDEEDDRSLTRLHNNSRKFESEYMKLILSFFYYCASMFMTVLCMAIAHDQRPDEKKYPPLPDIALDNIPYISWAFEMSEITGFGLLLILAVVLIFHKHRCIILRRGFVLAGTLYLLRCLTITVTALPVSSIHIECSDKVYGDIRHKLKMAWEHLMCLGLSIQGVNSCGDYMYSGHTIILTIVNFLIIEYTPRTMYLLHTITWIMNIFGMFFILAAHQHYTIDVVLAFYISSRLFLNYHSLANNRVLIRQPDSKRTRIWFPLFSFFESNVDGIVPNEYEWPFPWPQSFKKLLSS